MMKSRVIRVDDALWNEAGERAALLGLSAADFVRRCIRRGLEETESALATSPRGGAMWFVPPGAMVEDDEGGFSIQIEALTDERRVNRDCPHG